MAKQKRIIFFGAHPDDCELRFGGTALRLTQAGHVVKFVSCCNGDKGHQSMTSEGLAARRYAEAQKSKEIAGLAEYQILDIPDCDSLPRRVQECFIASSPVRTMECH